MKFINILLQLKLSAFLSLLCCQCNSSKTTEVINRTIYYTDFDIFKLKGSNPLKELNKKQSVEVTYNKGIPISIKYYKPERTVILVLEDSFTVNNNVPVYVYSTSNFHGGNPGRQRIYGTHYEEHKDWVYVTCNDTILCQTENIPADENFSFDLYVKKQENIIIRSSKGEIDYGHQNVKLTRKNLYLKWLTLLQKKYEEDLKNPIILNKLPE